MNRECREEWFKRVCLLLFCVKVTTLVGLFDIYVLNLAGTAGMFGVIMCALRVDANKNYNVVTKKAYNV